MINTCLFVQLNFLNWCSFEVVCEPFFLFPFVKELLVRYTNSLRQLGIDGIWNFHLWVASRPLESSVFSETLVQIEAKPHLPSINKI